MYLLFYLYYVPNDIGPSYLLNLHIDFRTLENDSIASVLVSETHADFIEIKF